MFHVIRTGAGAILAAFQADNGRRGDDIAPIVKQMRKQKWDIVQLTGLATILSPFGIITVLIAFVTIPVFFFFLFKPIPSEADIRTAIAASAA